MHFNILLKIPKDIIQIERLWVLICLRKQLILFYRGIVARLNKIAVPSPIIMWHGRQIVARRCSPRHLTLLAFFIHGLPSYHAYIICTIHAFLSFQYRCEKKRLSFLSFTAFLVWRCRFSRAHIAHLPVAVSHYRSVYGVRVSFVAFFSESKVSWMRVLERCQKLLILNWFSCYSSTTSKYLCQAVVLLCQLLKYVIFYIFVIFF